MWKTTGIFCGRPGGTATATGGQLQSHLGRPAGRSLGRRCGGGGGQRPRSEAELETCRDPASRQTVQLRRRVWWTGGLAGVATAYLPRISWSQARLALGIHQRFDYSGPAVRPHGQGFRVCTIRIRAAHEPSNKWTRRGSRR